jgi:uncharacterized membrane protein HdeD (DUF308 family)
MVGFKNLIDDKALLENFKNYSKMYGIIFLILGLFGMLFPVAMSLTTTYFVAWVFLFAGISIAVHTYQTNKKDWLGWLKALIFILATIFTFINPMSGVITLGIVFATFFLTDALISFTLAYRQRDQRGWWIIALNGLTSLILSVLFMINWPFSSIYLVGLYVGISLFFDGIVLLSMSSAVSKLEESKEEVAN